jgi:hypothetical protein
MSSSMPGEVGQHDGLSVRARAAALGRSGLHPGAHALVVDRATCVTGTMDDIVEVGKGWARQHPQTTEDPTVAKSPETAD